MKIYFYRLLVIIFLLMAVFQVVEAMPLIPGETDYFLFESVHFLKRKNQVEFFRYEIKKNSVVSKIRFEVIHHQAKKIIEKSQNDTYRKNQDHIINVLNYNDFLNLPEYIEDPNGKKMSLETLTKFKVIFKCDGMTINKEVAIENLESQIKNNSNKNAFRIKFIMLIIDKYKSSIYHYRKMSR